MEESSSDEKRDQNIIGNNDTRVVVAPDVNS
jgi:hypothetical protein